MPVNELHQIWATLRRKYFRVPDFFLNKPRAKAPLQNAPFKMRKQDKKPPLDKARKRRLLVGTVLFIVGAAMAVVAIGQFASLDFTLIAAALLVLCGAIIYDIISRRGWEQMLTARYENLALNHDRLVREVARNRNELAQLRETLAQAGHAAQAQVRHIPGTPEARMLDTIVRQLGALSDMPRPAMDMRTDDALLALEMKPPPRALQNGKADDHVLTPEKIRLMVMQAVRSDTIDVFAQPVVSLPQRKTRIMEVFARIRVGEDGHLSAAHYMASAEKENLVTAIDNLLLLRCLQMLRDTREEDDALPCALNISAATLHDAGFMNDLVAFLAQNKNLAARLIFELAQDDISELDNSLTPILSGLSQLGCRFSMDRVHQRDLSIRRLKAHHIRFLKLDAQWLIREGRSAGGLSRITQMKKQLDSAGIDLIIEKIESENDLRELLDFGVDYGQGFLFGVPELATARPLSTLRRRSA